MQLQAANISCCNCCKEVLSCRRLQNHMQLQAAKDSCCNCSKEALSRRRSPTPYASSSSQELVLQSLQEVDVLQRVARGWLGRQSQQMKYNDSVSHMDMLAKLPACPDLPSRARPCLDVFLEEERVSTWLAVQQVPYTVVRDAFVTAEFARHGAN